ncbi:hypothetical protein [Sphingomonas sp.]|jgi:hypothetical protein|uniref:hypothetical protein n=1 Tax=Sphingomonas sp. TaxID=28214 RepID=UPI002EDA29C5
MVALKTERRVFLWRVSPHAAPKDAGITVTFDQIFQILNDAFVSKKAFAHLDSDGNIVPSTASADPKKCIFIADIQVTADKKHCTFLINRGDPDVAHPSFINPIAQTVENVAPKGDQVQGWSAHMTIATVADSKGQHRACFERMQGVSSTLVQRYLDALTDAATEGDPAYVYDKPLKRGKKTVIEQRPYKLRLGINKIPSETLQKDLNDGVLSEITLIKTEPSYAGPGNPEVLNSVKEKLTIHTKKVAKDSAMDYIKEVTGWAKAHNYDEIQFRINSLPGDTTASPRFLLEKADAMDTLYARSRRLTGFTALLETCYAQISPEISSKMLAELTNESLW